MNLLDLTPRDFETVVVRLFEAFGFTVELTQETWDGGIDCVAIDKRPIVGGKILVQAKRFSGTVAASAVRDLYGLVIDQRASKGVIVTTGTFGPTSRTFAANKPLELIDGGELNALVQQFKITASSAGSATLVETSAKLFDLEETLEQLRSLQWASLSERDRRNRKLAEYEWQEMQRKKQV